MYFPIKVRELCRYPPPYFGNAKVTVGGRGIIPALSLPGLRRRGIPRKKVEL